MSMYNKERNHGRPSGGGGIKIAMGRLDLQFQEGKSVDSLGYH